MGERERETKLWGIQANWQEGHMEIPRPYGFNDKASSCRAKSCNTRNQLAPITKPKYPEGGICLIGIEE